VPPLPADLALKTGYEPDRFQKFAIEAIEAGENVLVTAKTGSGKTFVGEYQIAKSLQRGGRVFYTTPIKSLSNQKFHDLTKLFPEASVGIMTGDIKFRPDAQVIVMTTEILRNLLFKRGTATESVGLTALLSLEGLDAVVFDEVHYINDPDRGHVWEETLMLLPPAVKLILLSATLSSPFTFAKWLGESKEKRIWLISTLWRAVPLEHCVLEGGLVGSKPLVLMDSKEVYHADIYKSWVAARKGELLAHDKFKDKVRDARRAGFEGPVGGKTRPKSFEHELNECLGTLERHGNLPAIFFVFSRKGCESLARKVAGDFLDSSDAAKVRHIWDFHLSRFSDSLEHSPQHHLLRELAMRGIAFHHSGLLPFLKEILEILFSKGLIKVLFATETFAVGINMPTKTVVFTALEKYTDGQMRLLRTAEYIQMAGRAGRRGKDDRGLVIYLPQRDPVEPHELAQVLTGRAATFASRMTFHYDFVLKLLNTGRSAKDLIEGSYWKVLELAELAQEKKEIEALRQEAAALRRQIGPEHLEDCRTHQEIQGRIAAGQNAKRRAAQRELDTWLDDHRSPLWKSHLDRYSKMTELEGKLSEREEVVARVEAEADHEIPIVRLRCQILEEFGYVEKGDPNSLTLTAAGKIASEINEGHPFLMTELFLRQRSKRTLTAEELLQVLALFLGEREDDEGNVPIGELKVANCVKEELGLIQADARRGLEAEARLRMPDDQEFWRFSTEWVEPIRCWIAGDVSLSMLATAFNIFEGNLLKALMKLAGLLEEFQAAATLAGEIEMLRDLEDSRRLVLRDVVIAESLYLRL
jgi:superfamily II RNA helicase